MGNLKPIDSALVKDVDYDLISPDTVGGEYIETIGAACENPDGYTSSSLFLGRENGVQHLYRVTAAIAFGETIILDTNCVYTTVSGELEGKAEESEVNSLNEALTNEVATRAANGAHNLLENTATSQVIDGVTFTVNADKSITVSTGSGGATGNAMLIWTFDLEAGSYILSSGRNDTAWTKYSVSVYKSGVVNISDYEGGAFTLSAKATGIECRIRVASGTVITTPITFYPMIRLASDPDTTYQPYAKTNRELTDLSSFSPTSGSSNLMTSATYTVPEDAWFRFIVDGRNTQCAVYLNGIPICAALQGQFFNLVIPVKAGTVISSDGGVFSLYRFY